MGKGHRRGWKKAQKKKKPSDKKSCDSDISGAAPKDRQEASEIDPSERARRIKSMWNYLFAWPTVGIVVAILIGTGVGVLSMSPPKPTTAQWCFSAALAMLLVRFSWWIVVERQDPVWQRCILIALIYGSSGVLWFAA
jgi:hypothetical protein